MEEHLVRDEGVAGSNPATPTNLSLRKSSSSEADGRCVLGQRDSYRDRNASPMAGQASCGVPTLPSPQTWATATKPNSSTHAIALKQSRPTGRAHLALPRGSQTSTSSTLSPGLQPLPGLFLEHMAKIDDILIFCCVSGFFLGVVVRGRNSTWLTAGRLARRASYGRDTRCISSVQIGEQVPIRKGQRPSRPFQLGRGLIKTQPEPD